MTTRVKLTQNNSSKYIQRMKNSILFFIMAALLWSCGGEEEPQTVEEKEKKLVEYRKELATLNKKISDLEADIKDSKGKNPEDDYRTVEFMPLKSKTFNHYVEVQGNVESDKNVQVFPKTQGVVLNLKVEEGQRVSAGQVIAVLDAAQLEKAIAEIETRLELAKTVFERQANLWKQKIGSEVQYLQAKNNKEALEKQLETQKTALSNAMVTSPISGTVDQLMLNEGEMAAPSMPIARIVNLSVVEINAEVSENYTKAVQRGDEVQVSFPALDMEMPVRISMVGQTINPTNRTFRIQMKTANKDGYLKPNAMAVVKINDFSKKNAVAIPSNILQQSTTGERFVYVARPFEGNYKIEKVKVKAGLTYQGETLINEGLKADDLVVTAGYNEVIDGEPVKGIEVDSAGKDS